MMDLPLTVAVVVASILFTVGLFILLFKCGSRKSCVIGIGERNGDTCKMFIVEERVNT